MDEWVGEHTDDATEFVGEGGEDTDDVTGDGSGVTDEFLGAGDGAADGCTGDEGASAITVVIPSMRGLSREAGGGGR